MVKLISKLLKLDNERLILLIALSSILVVGLALFLILKVVS